MHDFAFKHYHRSAPVLARSGARAKSPTSLARGLTLRPFSMHPACLLARMVSMQLLRIEFGAGEGIDEAASWSVPIRPRPIIGATRLKLCWKDKRRISG